MALTLDPRFPRVWRSPHTLQFGVEQPVLVLDSVGHAEERMLAALASGVAPGALGAIAQQAGAHHEDVDRLLARLGPVLLSTGSEADDSGTVCAQTAETASADAPDAAAVVVLDGAGPTAWRILGLLRDGGVEVRGIRPDEDECEDDNEQCTVEAAVIVAAYAVEPRRHQRWLRRDVPHVPVVFGDAGVTVGPVVRPGKGPCLRCGDLHRRDADDAWPAMAAQLHMLPPPGETELACGAAASVVAGMVLALLAGSEAPADIAWRFDPASGRWSEQLRQGHPECGCVSL